MIDMSIGNICQSRVIRHSSSESGMGTITILKTGEHYDAIIPVMPITIVRHVEVEKN